MPPPTFPSDAGQTYFVQSLRKALKSLYDPTILMDSPLFEFLGLEKKGDAVAALRRVLIEAIERIKPDEGEPDGVKTWRLYHVLHQRYAMQWSQYRVASNIGIGDRQLLREEKSAIEMLAEMFWREYQLGSKVQPQALPENTPEADLRKEPGNSLVQASSLIQPEFVLINALIRDVLKTLKPVIERADVDVRLQTVEEQRLYLRGPVLRQALLLVFNQAISKAQRGQLIIRSEVGEETAVLSIFAVVDQSVQSTINEPWRSLEDVQGLMRSCDGILQFKEYDCPPQLDPCPDNSRFAVQLILPALKRAAILFVDDHADTLQLYRRFLEESRYRFISAGNARQGLSLAKHESPQVIVLDVMMPQQDGWGLLEQLRVHPQTQHIPVLICSIVPQDELAQALGAAEFLQKPLNRESLLAALDRHSHWQQVASG